MKNFLRIIFPALILMMMIPAVKAGQMNALFSYTTFDSPEKGPYIETYISVEGQSVQFIRNENGKFQASIEVLLLFRKNKEIVNFDKYSLNSPELEDTTDINFNFLDQQRYSLNNGMYEFELQIKDQNSNDEPFITLQPLELNFPENEVTISGIQLVDTYKKVEASSKLTKNGYDLVPYIHNFYPGGKNTLTFYCEIYNSKKILGENEKFLVSYYIQTMEKAGALPGYVNHKKFETAPAVVVFNEFDITNLKSGNYFLVIEVKNRENKLIAKNKLFFQRSNPRIKFTIEDLAVTDMGKTFAGRINNVDTLKEYIRSLAPISSEYEKNFAIVHMNNADLETLQKYFYKFWIERNPLEPQQEWEKYYEEVTKVNIAYSTLIQKGYETDRGRVYLKYGPPNAISESYNEPSAYPYEIWHYYVLPNGQRNKRFVFYTKDMVTNDFTLLHSDASGELSNYRWQYILYQRVDPGYNLDDTDVPDSWGDNTKKYFDLPR
ncbi:MAG: GWxTD domain-containing protein [Bacteroidales bacterium]|nr:GWxTD domain-containing protein [Bacteroidales bacterium]